MACLLTTTQASACNTGLAKVSDPILLLQLIAQLTADLLTATSPSTSTTLAAITARSLTSGIGCVQDEITLLQLIAQNTCELTI